MARTYTQQGLQEETKTIVSILNEKIENLMLQERQLLMKSLNDRFDYLRKPMPRWYEKADSNFSFELHKNSKHIYDHIKMKDFYIDLCKIRDDLKAQRTENNK
jgi:hypothetical protein